MAYLEADGDDDKNTDLFELSSSSLTS